ncbi:hypothetical protein M3Y95_00430400 [Aphelenchoides besseyi]|nr:hypothetical protein M3Y95_00430400 [Aphelenchoides besseyi]
MSTKLLCFIFFMIVILVNSTAVRNQTVGSFIQQNQTNDINQNFNRVKENSLRLEEARKKLERAQQQAHANAQRLQQRARESARKQNP